MPGGAPALGVWKFGTFELDPSSGELRRNGTLVHLPPQPLQILTLLVAHSGEVVDRDRIRQEVWGETALDFDRSVNVAIAQIRSVLHDDAASPRFVQTVPRKGYRFLAGVERNRNEVPPAAAKSPRRLAVAAILGVAVAAMLSAGALRYWRNAGAPVRIAVLPFENLSPESVATARADGLFDDLLTGLAGIQPHRLEVIGPRSVYGVNARGPGSVRELGNRLHVGYVLDSSIRSDAGSLRVAVRLVETSHEAVRWSSSFVEDHDAPFGEAVVGRVTAGVLTVLFPGASPGASATSCEQGREAFDTGRMLIHRGGLQDLQRSLDFFEQSGCPSARAEYADVQVRLLRAGAGQPDSWESARQTAQAAIRADSNLSLAHVALGNVAFWHDWDWTAAQRELREAIRINPSDPDAHHDLAWLDLALGRRSEAAESLETALALDPLSARTRIDSAWLLLQMGEFQRAAAEARRALELQPRMNEARFCLSRALLYQGDLQAARQAMEPLMPGALVQELAGLPSNAALRRLIAFQTSNAATDPYQRAWSLAFLGSRSEALSALEQGLATRNMMMPLAVSDPAFRSLRADPRFRSIVRKMGLPM